MPKPRWDRCDTLCLACSAICHQAGLSAKRVDCRRESRVGGGELRQGAKGMGGRGVWCSRQVGEGPRRCKQRSRDGQPAAGAADTRSSSSAEASQQRGHLLADLSVPLPQIRANPFCGCAIETTSSARTRFFSDRCRLTADIQKHPSARPKRSGQCETLSTPTMEGVGQGVTDEKGHSQSRRIHPLAGFAQFPHQPTD